MAKPGGPGRIERARTALTEDVQESKTRFWKPVAQELAQEIIDLHDAIDTLLRSAVIYTENDDNASVSISIEAWRVFAERVR